MKDATRFQICHEGDLTLEITEALRRLGAIPNFDQSWEVRLAEPRRAEVLARHLRTRTGPDARLLVAPVCATRAREYLLVRHSLTPGAVYAELHDALERLGWLLELPFESTFVVETEDRTDLTTLGEALAHLCPDESLMVSGIGGDFAWCAGAGARPLVAPPMLATVGRVRTF
ncbi:MAG: hypothetical protein ACRD2J_17495 [Thermoanaerobaculia bacterium]